MCVLKCHFRLTKKNYFSRDRLRQKMNPLLMKNSAVQEVASWGNEMTKQLIEEWSQELQTKSNHLMDISFQLIRIFECNPSRWQMIHIKIKRHFWTNYFQLMAKTSSRFPNWECVCIAGRSRRCWPGFSEISTSETRSKTWYT